MDASRILNSVGEDEIDAKLVHALKIWARAPFSVIADAIGVSEQTVARRYRRLRSEGVVRVVGMVSPRALGEADWMVRVRCRPSGARAVADALARRDDISWVSVTSAGSEVTCSLQTRTGAERDELLLQRLPNTAPVLNISAYVLMHHFVGGQVTDWSQLDGPLGPAQRKRIVQTATRRDPSAPRITELDAADEAIAMALMRDGRASYATLAAASGLTEGRVTRRLDALIRAGVVYFDLDFATAAIGFPVGAYLWTTVTPGKLHEIGTEVTTHKEVAWVAACSGPANLLVSVLCRDLDELYAYVTSGIGIIDGVQSVDLAPILERVKQAGALMDGPRLAHPAPHNTTRRRQNRQRSAATA